MCLAIPGKVVRWLDLEPPFAKATIEFGGVSRPVWMSCVDNAEPGDYVLVHAGIAICRIDAVEAKRTLAALAEIDNAEELREHSDSDNIPS